MIQDISRGKAHGNMKSLQFRKISQIDFTKKQPLTIVNLFAHSNEYDWIEPELRAADINVFTFRMTAPNKKINFIRGAWIALKAIWVARKNNAVLFSHAIEAANTVGFLMYLPGLRLQHIAYTWHFRLYPARKRQIIALNLVKKNIDAYVVHSKIEEDSIPDSFDIPPEKIYTAYWAYENKPDVSNEPAKITGDYICTIGASQRDYKTLFKAMRKIPDKNLIVVCRPYNVEGLDIPANVEIHTLVTLSDCWNYIKHCKIFVLPLPAATTVTGHSVLVQAMRERKPCIVTDAASMQFYAEDNVTVKMVDVGDAAAIATEINALWDDPERASELADHGHQFAEANFSQTAVASAFFNAIGYTPENKS